MILPILIGSLYVDQYLQHQDNEDDTTTTTFEIEFGDVQSIRDDAQTRRNEQREQICYKSDEAEDS